MTKAMAQVNSEPCRPRRHLLRCTGARATARCENGSAVLEAWRLAMAALSVASAFAIAYFASIRRYGSIWTFGAARSMSELPTIADVEQTSWKVRNVPRGDIIVTTDGLSGLGPSPGAG